MKNQHRLLWLKFAIHIAAFMPLAYMFIAGINDQLGGDPVQALIHFTGIGAFNVLLLSLMVSPVAKTSKLPLLMQTRRLIGLYAFFYALLHVLSFLAFDLVFDFSLFINELFERVYIWFGLVALVILLLMAITSPSIIKRKMGKRWQQLHNFVYLAAPLIAIHFYWSVKSDIIEPVIYLVITFLILTFRKSKLLKLLIHKVKG